MILLAFAKTRRGELDVGGDGFTEVHHILAQRLLFEKGLIKRLAGREQGHVREWGGGVTSKGSLGFCARRVRVAPERAVKVLPKRLRTNGSVGNVIRYGITVLGTGG